MNTELKTSKPKTISMHRARAVFFYFFFDLGFEGELFSAQRKGKNHTAALR